MSLDRLIESLQELEQLIGHERFKNKYITDSEGIPLNHEQTLKLNEILRLADGALITEDGDPHHDNMKVMRNAGYSVVKGESDGFGWLSGVILTKVGKIVFG